MPIEETEFEKIRKETEEKANNNLSDKIVRSADFPNLDIPEPEFIVDKLIPKATITSIVGKPSSGKSWLLLEIAKNVATGNLLFERFKTKENKVLYVDEESSLAEIKRRWLKLENLGNVDFLSMQGFKIDDGIKRKELLEIADSKKYKLIIFDSLRSINDLEENNSKDSQSLIDYFREFTRAGITILISHHNRKEGFLTSKDLSQMIRGSTGFLAGLDCFLSVDFKKKDEERLEYIITQPKIRQGRNSSPFRVSLIEEKEKIKFSFIGMIEDEIQVLNKTKDAILELLEEKGEMYGTEIKETLIPSLFSGRTINRAIAKLKEEKKVEPQQKGHKVYLHLVK